MKLLIDLDEEYVNAIDKIEFLVGGRTNCKLQLEIIKSIKNGKPQEQDPTIKNDLGVDCISRQAVLDLIADYDLSMGQVVKSIHDLPFVNPQEPKCNSCKWWKDSDGEYRRGCGAESQCPINRREVFEGNGYCYIYEPQESEDK